jgi:polyamine oxidase
MFSLLPHAVAPILLISSPLALSLPVLPPAANDFTGAPATGERLARQANDPPVLILGGGMAGVIAARTLATQGITNFLIVEARDELGGRMYSTTFGAPNRELTVELGANWIHGTQEGNGPANPIYDLALKHGLVVVESDAHTSLSASM